MKDLLHFIWKQNRTLLIACNITIGITGFLSVLVVKETKVVIDSLEKAQTDTLFAIIAYAILYALANTISQFQINIIGSRAKAALLAGLSHQLLLMPFKAVEAKGDSLVNAIYRECETIGKTLISLCTSGRNFAILFSLIGYAFYLSPIITTIALAGRFLFSLFVRRIKRKYRRLLSEEKVAQNSIRQNMGVLVSGFKELSLNSVMRKAFFNNAIAAPCRLNKRQNILLTLIKNGLTTAIEVLVLVIGICLVYAAIIHSMLDLATATNLLIVFIMARVQLANASNAMLKFEEFRASAKHLRAQGFDFIRIDENAPNAIPPLTQRIGSIALRKVAYQYDPIDTRETFTLHPTDLAFEAPGIYMFVGGNGSGKSTIAKLICGLYRPTNGTILLNNIPIDDSNRNNYQQLFSAVFSDFQLFGTATRVDIENVNEKTIQLLTEFNLVDQVSQIRNKPAESLSTGQKKRLALALSLIEDRPIYIFDEWAAEQDPEFRDFFYQVILKRLKEQKKWIFVITHHLDYVHVGDVVFEVNGGIVTQR